MQVGALSTRRATVLTWKSLPIAARQSRRTTSKVFDLMFDLSVPDPPFHSIGYDGSFSLFFFISLPFFHILPHSSILRSPLCVDDRYIYLNDLLFLYRAGQHNNHYECLYVNVCYCSISFLFWTSFLCVLCLCRLCVTDDVTGYLTVC